MVIQLVGTLNLRFGAAIANASETGTPSFEHPFEGSGSFVDWAEWTTMGTAGLIVLVVLLTVLAGRKFFSPNGVQFLRFVGLFALPIFLLVVGTFANLEGSKRVDFCQSCHTAMELYVDDMRNVKSNTLAAVHYKNRYIHEEQCYHCHADYGVHGAVSAKSRGLIHLYHWIANSPTAQGEKQIKHYGAYPNTLCLACHAGGQAFLAIEDHMDFQDDLITKDPETGETGMSCLDCHGPAHKPLAEKLAARKGD